MSRAEAVVYYALSAVAATACALFASWWSPVVWRGPGLALSAVAAFAVAMQLAAWWARWIPLELMRRPRPMPMPRGPRVAAVTTIVPAHESIVMLEHTLQAIIAMSGPHDSWVLDESDSPEVRALCARLGARHFSRRAMPQYQAAEGPFQSASKHGNYNAWLAAHGYAEYDVLVAFDTDHVPEPGYLETVLGYLVDDDIAFVQPPQVYYNQEASFIARGAAEETYAYYSSHLLASYALGHAIVIGSHGAHRLEALRGVGGFPAHDAEDLYLTMLYRAHGWRGVYVPDVLAMGMTPVDWSGYLAQQLRWARSVIDLKMRVLPRLAGSLSMREMVLNLLHGVFYLRPLLVPVLYGALVAALLYGQSPGVMQARALAPLVGLVAILAVVGLFRQRYYLNPRHERGVHWRAVLLQFAKWPVFLIAVADALSGRRVGYALTDKSGASAERRFVLAPVQLAAGLLVAAAWATSVAWYGSVPATLTVAAAAVVLVCLVLACSELWSFPPAFVAGLHRARRGRATRTRASH